MCRLAFHAALIFTVLAPGVSLGAAASKATTLAKDGDRLYKEGKYREAAEALKQAYDLEKNPVFLFNVARAYDQAGDLQLALENYRTYVSLPDVDPALVKRANLAMDRLRALVARGEADKQVQEAEQKRLKEEADAARRKADEEAERARKQKEEYDAKEAARLREQNKGAGARLVAGIVLGVVAVGAAGTGTAFGLLANGSKASFSSAVTLEEKKRFEGQTKTQALIADLALVGALAFAVTFAIVFPWSSIAGSGGGDVHVALAPNGVSLGGTF